MTKSNGTTKRYPSDRSERAKMLVEEGRFGGNRVAEGSGRRRLWPDRLRSLLSAAVEDHLNRGYRSNPDEVRAHIRSMQTAIRMHEPLERERVSLLARSLLQELHLPPAVRIVKEEDGRDLVCTLLWRVGRKASIKTWGTDTFDVDALIAEALPRLTPRELCETILLGQFMRPRPWTAPGEEVVADSLDEAVEAILYDEIGTNVLVAVENELSARGTEVPDGSD